MSLKIFEKFDPRANPIDGNYPTGSIKNETVPGANDGTPLDAEWGNDYVGFTDALLDDAEITPNGDADEVNNSDRLNALKISANKAAQTPLTLASVVSDIKLKINMARIISDRANGVFDVVLLSSVTPNGYNIIACTGVPTLALVLRIGMIIDIRKFGAKHLTNSTLAVQAAIDESSSLGGIPISGGAETYYVSNTTSGTTEHAIEMKSNVWLNLPSGAEITKSPAERAVNGSIIGIGVATSYGGATNFKISGFKLSDGDVNKGARTIGSLITLNSGTDFEISGMEFGNSDFHDIDIRACKNGKIWGNSHNSLVVGGSAPYQFDVVTNATDSALFPNDNIQIYQNTRGKHSALDGYYERSFEFAHGCTSKGIKIFNNNFDETNNSLLSSVVGNATERDEKIDGLEVYFNTFRIDGVVPNWVNLTINETNDFDASTNYMKGINIHHNKLYGKTSQGMQLSMVVGGMTNFGQFDAQIHDNELEFNVDVLTGSSFGGLQGQLLTDISVMNNKIKILTADTAYVAFKDLPIINFGSCEQCSYTGNELFIIGDITNSFIQLRPVKYKADLLVDLGLVGTWDCVNNKLYGDTFTHGILLNNYAGIEPTVLRGKVSGNFVYGSPLGAGSHYSLGGNVFLSDGTNNLQYIDWGVSGVVGETEVLALSNNFKLLNHPLPFKVESNVVPMVKGLISTVSQDLSDFAMDITKQYLSASTTAGTSLEFVQGTNDDINVICGTSGVHMNFNETTQQPLFYANGWLRVLAGC